MPTKIELGLVVGDCTEELRQFTELTNSAPPPMEIFTICVICIHFPPLHAWLCSRLTPLTPWILAHCPPQRMLGLILLHIILKVNGKIVQIFTKTFVEKYKYLLMCMSK